MRKAIVLFVVFISCALAADMEAQVHSADSIEAHTLDLVLREDNLRGFAAGVAVRLTDVFVVEVSYGVSYTVPLIIFSGSGPAESTLHGSVSLSYRGILGNNGSIALYYANIYDITHHDRMHAFISQAERTVPGTFASLTFYAGGGILLGPEERMITDGWDLVGTIGISIYIHIF